MIPNQVFDNDSKGSGKLLNKNCIITGGDSGIGRCVAVAFAKEGADVAIIYLKQEHKDAMLTTDIIQSKYNWKCILVNSNISEENNWIHAIKNITQTFKRVHVLANNAAMHFPVDDILKITSKQLINTFSVNIFAIFWIIKAVVPFMKEGANINYSTSVTAYRGNGGLIDYCFAKGAIVSFTRSF